MRYLWRGLFLQNKFQVKFIGPNLFFPWLLVFYYLTDAFVLVLFHLYMTSTSSMEKQSFANVLQNRCFWKIRKWHRKTQVFSCEIWKIFKNTFFYRTPPVAASMLLFMFLLLLLPCCRTFTTSLQYCYFLHLKKHFRLYITTSLLS